jgi:ribosomal peptide maturation radical SAM protein 1
VESCPSGEVGPDQRDPWKQFACWLERVPAGNVLLILPPFAGIDRPSLGLHTLQACARARGHGVSVLYANMLFAQLVGEMRYEALCYAPTSDLLGERIFAVAAYGRDYPGGGRAESEGVRTALRLAEPVDAQEIGSLQDLACGFVRQLVALLASQRFSIVGCNSTFEQTSAGVAILSSLKEQQPDVVTLMGGANCEGEMAQGVRTLSGAIDYVFSGESEASFPDFLDRLRSGHHIEGGIVEGTPCNDLDAVPVCDYSDYYAQLDLFSESGFLRRTGSVWLPYETSRGCWWGQKHHCTFCGINGGGMAFREKSPEVVLEQLPALLARHPTNKVLMVDNIMPVGYFDTLLPRLAAASVGMHAFYEQKANLTLQRVKLLKEAGVAVIQPGIEALSTGLLRLMKKGVSAAQNISLLRYARSLDVSVNWNLLYAFPGDSEEHYEETIRILPLISHLSPPSDACHLSIDRFSPYFDHAMDYGVSNVRPMDAYETIFPADVDKSLIAYHFIADYDCATRRDPALVDRMRSLINGWRAAWSRLDERAPVLAVEQIGPDLLVLCDTRCLDTGSAAIRFISREQAVLALTGFVAGSGAEGLRRWALDEAKVAVEIEQKIVPLATARAQLLDSFEAEVPATRARVVQLMVAS